jgi:hypothetical protein
MIYFLYNLSNGISNFFQNLLGVIIAFIKILIQSKLGLSFPKTASKKAIILANGPSLKVSLEKDLDFILTNEVYCVNNFASSDAFAKIKPQNYVILDPAYFSYNEQNTEREDIKKTLNAFLNQVNWQMNLYLPIYAKKSYLVDIITQSNKNIGIHYFNYTIVKTFKGLQHWLFRNLLAMPQCQNILSASIYISITRKHQEVYLLGADHSWIEEFKLNDDNQLIGRQLHFYDDPSKLKFEDIATVIKVSSKGFMAAQMLSLHKAFYAYEVLADYANSQNVKVLNASVKSYIDSFEKIRLSPNTKAPN